MNDNKALLAANVAVVALFTILAIVFGKWWIVLLSCLLMMSPEDT